MNLFVCVICPNGAPVTDELLASYRRHRYWQQLRLASPHFGSAAVLLCSDGATLNPSVAQYGPLIAVGVARLDNRDEIQQWLGLRHTTLSDLALILRSVAMRGLPSVARLLGAFAVVMWRSDARTVIAARDSLGVRTLYYTVTPTHLAFSCRAQLLAPHEKYDVQYLAERLAYADHDPQRTPFVGVKAIPAGTILQFHQGRLSLSRVWSPSDVASSDTPRIRPRTAVDEFRALLVSAVRLSLSDAPDTWAHLSGGLDSSSVVSIAQWLASTGAVPHGLAGTITWVGDSGTGSDERDFVQAVVARYEVRNEQLADFASWSGDLGDPPLTDVPTGRYPFHALDQRTVALVREAGGRVLLTGNGGDHLLLGSMLFFADWLIAGRIWQTVREMAHRAALGHVSLWELAYRNAVLPLLPRHLRNVLVFRRAGPPPWLSRDLLRRYDLRSRLSSYRAYDGRLGHKYADYCVQMIADIQNDIQDGLLHDRLDVRHPYLYRPLVDFVLRLPPELCVQPHQRKWILREALRDILPDTVRTRVGKAAAMGTTARWLATQREYVSELLRDPILAELGCVDVPRLRNGLGRLFSSSSPERQWVDVYNTLAIEMWLRARSGRWPKGGLVPRSSQSEVIPLHQITHGGVYAIQSQGLCGPGTR